VTGLNRILSFLLVGFVLVGSLLLAAPNSTSAVLSDSLLSFQRSESLVPVIVELSEPALLDHPVLVETKFFQQSDREDQKEELHALQQQLIRSQQQWLVNLQRKPISFFYRSSCQYVGNFVNLWVKGSDLQTLSKQYDVQTVLLDWEEKPFRKIMSVSTGATKVWAGTSSLPKASGKNIKIGIIDSGIDPNHPEFEKKIVKGVDFTDDENYKEDGIGHGTHVAGISAGSGSSQNGKGMAFDSLLYVYKVFSKAGGGSAGSDVFQALDMAVADQLHVVNLSLGHVSDAKAKESNMYYSIIQKVIKAKVFVVAAVGNSGARGKEVPWPAGSPGVVEDAFCIAASNDRKYSPTLYSTDHSFQFDALNEFSAQSHFQLNCSELIDVSYGRAEDYASKETEGKLFLISRGPDQNPLSFSEKYQIALSYHPKGVIFSSPTSLPKEFLQDLSQEMNRSGANIPVLMVRLQDAQTLLEKSADANACLYQADNGLSIADFSSMGPSSDGVFKPELSAPGVDILSTIPKKYGSYVSWSGTSMATPSVTGLIALVKELKPDWSINQIKSAFMNNADLIMNEINQEPITFTLQGAGQARVDKALATEAFLSPRAFIVESQDQFSQEITIQNAKSTDIVISSIKTELYGLAKNDLIQIQYPTKAISLKPSETAKITFQFTIQREQFKRSKYEGNIWLNQMHIPFIIYRDTTEIENFNAIKNPVSDLQIEKADLFSCDAKTTNRIEFAFNTGSEQKFEGEIQYSNFGTIKLFLCDEQGLEWVVKPIIEYKQCPVGCYAFDWDYQDYIRQNSIPDGNYRLKITSSASQSFELLSAPIHVYDSPEPDLGSLFVGLPRYQQPESEITFHISAVMKENFEEIEYTWNYDDSRIRIENVTLNPMIKTNEPPVMKSNYVKIVVPSSGLPLNQRFEIASVRAVTLKKLGTAALSHKISVKSPGQKQKIRIQGYLPEVILSKKGELNADVNKDGKTDLTDFFAITKRIGLEYSQPDFQSVYDINQDKTIDMLDYEAWHQEFAAY